MKIRPSIVILYLIHLQSVTDAIGYGTIAKPPNFGWHAEVRLRTIKNIKKDGFSLITALCGGALISHNFVLTAKHCVNHTVYSLKNITVLLGVFDLRRKNLLKVSPIRLIKHPEDYDIALLRLPNGLKFNNQIRPIDLPPRNLNYKELNGQVAYLSGFGYDENEQLYTTLRYTALLIITPAELPDCRLYGSICAHSPRYKVVNQGDSGSALVFFNRRTLTYFLIGISSQTFVDDLSIKFVRVDQFCNWISQNTGIKLSSYKYTDGVKRPLPKEFSSAIYWSCRILRAYRVIGNIMMLHVKFVGKFMKTLFYSFKKTPKGPQVIYESGV